MTVHSHKIDKVREAFFIAPLILADLEKLGITYPSFTLYKDGSGSLNLGVETAVTEKQFRKAVELIHSNRLRPCHKCLLSKSKDDHVHEIKIDFCGGLLEEARRRNGIQN